MQFSTLNFEQLTGLGGERRDVRHSFVLQTQGEEHVPQFLQRELGQVIGREIDGKLALKGLKLVYQRRAIPGLQNADEFLDLV